MTNQGRSDSDAEEAEGGAPIGWPRRGWVTIRRALANPRVRGEVGWVVLNKGMEFGLLFALLKILTNRLGKAGFGEYNLAETALLLVTGIVVMPMNQSYLRDFHGAQDRNERRSAGLLLLRWYAFSTIGVAVVATALSAQLSDWFGIGRWTALAAGLIFLFERWRFLGQDVLNIERRRRTGAIYNVSYQAVRVLLITGAVHLASATPSAALFAYAAASAVFAVLVAGPLIRDILRLPAGNPSHLMGLTLTFGAPFAALLLFQWLQGFSDRYLVAALMDAASVGLYVAAFQVCGIPYTLLLRIVYTLLTPIAYQRGRDVDDPASLWAADKLLIAGTLAQIAIGTGMLAFYAFFGQRLLVLLTNDQFVLPVSTVVLLAAGRFVQSISQSLQPIFAVHHRMGSMLWFRLFGAAVTFVICWRMIAAYGIFGAAAGSFMALSIYLVGLVFGPYGCWWLAAEARRRALERGR